MPSKIISKNRVLNACKIHFLFIGLLVAQIILYDASKLISPEVVLKRWFTVAALLIVVGIVWFKAKNESSSANYSRLIFYLIFADIALISYSVYSQRGMAARAVALYAIPIIVSALLARRSAVYFVAILSIAAYTLSSIAYFVWNFNEGYKVELYGEIGFYSFVFLILAGLTSLLINNKN